MYFGPLDIRLISFVGLVLVLVPPLTGADSTDDVTEDTKVPVPPPPDTDPSNTTHVVIKVQNNTVKAWSLPSDILTALPPKIYSPYSAAMLSALVKNYHDHSTTNDPLNEVYYTRRRIGDNVWFNVERVAPFKTFMEWAISTSKIMDRRDSSGKSMINWYIQNTNVPCSPETAFRISEEVIMSDHVSLRMKLDSSISSWVKSNHKTPPQKICNKFRGLTCNPDKGLCECETRSDNSLHYVTYTRADQDKPGEYRDGCYVKPWKKCSHLSMDNNIPAEYKSYHAHSNNMKQFLLRLATPLPRMARCERGSYCVDMILNQRRPICWCSSRMYSKECFNSAGVPMLDSFLGIRRLFHQMIIPERDKSTKCMLEPHLDDKLMDILELNENVQENYRAILGLMKEVVGKGGRGGRICDFRKGLACDPYRKTCTYRSGCGPGRVIEEDMSFGRECHVNNGYPCPTIELECVSGAECKDFGQGRHCHCSLGKYGDLCRFGEATFFSSLLQSRISGFVGYHFANFQELVNHILAPVERLMVLNFGEKCNPSLDRSAMNIVRYMGGVRLVILEQMDHIIATVQYLVGKDEPLCNYRRFLGCTAKAVCEPLIPDVVKYDVVQALELPGRAKIYLSLRPMARCSGPGNYSNIPPIFYDIIHVQCLPHHECRRVEERINSRHKYCLCSPGYRGLRCSEKIVQVKNVEVYEIPEGAPAAMMIPATNRNGKEKHIDIIHIA